MDNSAGDISGGCLCGGVRYRLPANQLRDLNDCHCVDCRRSSGAPYVTWGTASAAVVAVTGPLRRVEFAQRVRTFAGCCGTPLFFQAELDAAELDIAIATLDDPLPFPPEFSIWTEDRLPWVLLDANRPAFPRSRRHGLTPDGGG